MVSATYENILREVEHLTNDEQHLLLEILKRRPYTPDAIRMLQNKVARNVPLSDHDRTAVEEWFTRVDGLADQVSAAWIDLNISAVDAVREQRRDL